MSTYEQGVRQTISDFRYFTNYWGDRKKPEEFLEYLKEFLDFRIEKLIEKRGVVCYVA